MHFTSMTNLIFPFQAKELNHSGHLYLQKYPKLRLRIVDGSSLAAAVVLNNIPQGTTQVLLKGRLTKVAFATAEALCKKGVQVHSFLHNYKFLLIWKFWLVKNVLELNYL